MCSYSELRRRAQRSCEAADKSAASHISPAQHLITESDCVQGRRRLLSVPGSWSAARRLATRRSTAGRVAADSARTSPRGALAVASLKAVSRHARSITHATKTARRFAELGIRTQMTFPRSGRLDGHQLATLNRGAAARATPRLKREPVKLLQ